MVRLVLMGPPGAGKGTQAAMVASEFEIPHVSTGDMLRQAVAEKTALGLEAKKTMDEGRLVSDQTIVGIIRERLARSDCDRGVVLDGFPRTLPQAEALETILADRSEPTVLIANIDVEDEVLVKRIAGRRSCPKCKLVYNLHVKPPSTEGKCDSCGTELNQRDDDREDTVRNRLKVYGDQTKPLLDYYEGRFQNLDGSGTPEQIFEQLAGLVRDCKQD